ncbi:MAG: class I SAM-dependent RNA methyltransferase, partial [Bdellovibrionales bacterium]
MGQKNSLTPETGELIELTIDSLSYFGGRGVGRFEGVVVFVPQTAPQERIRARVTAKKSRFWEAELVEVLSPSPSRRVPPCAVAGRCGGCSWQHVVYSVQVEQKSKILRESLRKLHGFEWLPFLEAPSEFHYRNRIQLQLRGGKKGFFALRTRDLIPIESCTIAEEILNDEMRTLEPADLAGHQRLELALTEEGRVMRHAGNRDPETAVFAQVNRDQNEVLKRRLVDLVQIAPDWIMDLYSGSGNLTYPLRDRFLGVPITAVEGSREAVARGRMRAPDVEWFAGDVERILSRLKERPGQGLVVLDPPRTGASQHVLQDLARLRPRQILYVSCKPMTFARDALRLCGLGEYRLEKVQGLDMFPQTEHVELLASLCT